MSISVRIVFEAPFGSGLKRDEACADHLVLYGLAYVPRIGESIFLGGDVGLPVKVSDVWHDPGAKIPVRVWLQDTEPDSPLAVGRTKKEAESVLKWAEIVVRAANKKRRK